LNALRVLPFCGCQLGAGLHSLTTSGKVVLTTDEAGLNAATYTMSEVLQRVRFFRGAIEIPEALRYYCNLPKTLSAGTPALRNIEKADLVLLEPNTTLDVFFDNYALHRSQLLTGFLDNLQAAGGEVHRAINSWFNQGIWGRNRQVQHEAAETIIPALAGRVEDEYLARNLLLEAHGEEQDFEQYLESLREFCRVVDLPIGLVTFVFEFLPDGRPMGWPADFVENTLEAARMLGLPVLDSAEAVNRHGVDVALREGRRIYKDEFRPIVGEATLEFCHKVLGHTAGH